VATVYIIVVFEKGRIKIKFLALYVNFFEISRLRDRFRMFIFEFLEGILTCRSTEWSEINGQAERFLLIKVFKA